MDEQVKDQKVWWLVKRKEFLDPKRDWKWWQHTFRRTEISSKYAVDPTEAKPHPVERYYDLERRGLARCVKVTIQEVEGD